MRWVVGVDGGARCGIALLERQPPGRRPIVRVLHAVHGADHLWLKRIKSAVDEILTITHGDDVALYVENPPMTQRTGALEGDRRGHTTWLGMGRRKGMVEAAWFYATGRIAASAMILTQAVS